jgi:hypothetical protein
LSIELGPAAAKFAIEDDGVEAHVPEYVKVAM